jgi:hypothetical protein
MDGFARRGIDLGIADLIVGTSAGAVVGARLALKQDFGASQNIAAAIASTPAPVHPDTMANLGAAMVRAAQSSEPELIRAEIGFFVVLYNWGQALLHPIIHICIALVPVAGSRLTAAPPLSGGAQTG